MKTLRVACLLAVLGMLMCVPATFARQAGPKAFRNYKQVARMLRRRDFRNAFDTLDDTVGRNLGQQGLRMGELLPAAAAMVDVAMAAAVTTENGTNVQVAGVGEGDIVKTDGDLLYVLSEAHLAVIQAADDEGTPLELLSLTRLRDDRFVPSELYLYGHFVAVVGSVYDFRFLQAPTMDAKAANLRFMQVMPPARVGVRLYDVSDPENVVLVRGVDVEGTLVATRRIDNRLFVITRAYPALDAVAETSRGEAGAGLVPRVADSLIDGDFHGIRARDIARFPDCYEAAYLVVATLDMSTSEGVFTSQAFLGAGNVVSASTESIYVASSSWLWRPIFVADSRAMRKVSPDETQLFRFAIEADGVSFAARGSVPGRVLNSFCMDEYGESFRIATTVYPDVWSEGAETSGVYTFDRQLKRQGSVTGLAPGERIYAARFMGDRGYLVTFERIDPLFVVDLSHPEAPTVAGELKIPGYSSYLHPFDANHVIGFGKDVTLAVTPWSGDEGVPFEQGLKLSLFDVSTLGDPIELHSTVLGARGSQSEALTNHHAFMFDPARALLAFPCTLRSGPVDPGAEPWWWGDFAFQGVVTFEVTLEDGFDESGRITHVEDDAAGLWDAPWYRTIRRALLAGNLLHTVSEGMVQAHNAETMTLVDVLEMPWEAPGTVDPVLQTLRGVGPMADELMGMGATADEVAGPGGVLHSATTPAHALGGLIRDAVEARR